MSAKKGLDALQKLFATATQTHLFNRVTSKVKIVDGGEGRCVGELTVDEEHENHFGSLHGGLTATLVDVLTTTALMTTASGRPGASIDLSVSYLNGAKHGETIIIDAIVLKEGKRLAFTKAEIRRKSDNQLVAIAQHTKAFPN